MSIWDDHIRDPEADAWFQREIDAEIAQHIKTSGPFLNDEEEQNTFAYIVEKVIGRAPEKWRGYWGDHRVVDTV